MDQPAPLPPRTRFLPLALFLFVVSGILALTASSAGSERAVSVIDWAQQLFLFLGVACVLIQGIAVVLRERDQHRQ